MHVDPLYSVKIFKLPCISVESYHPSAGKMFRYDVEPDRREAEITCLSSVIVCYRIVGTVTGIAYGIARLQRTVDPELDHRTIQYADLRNSQIRIIEIEKTQ